MNYGEWSLASYFRAERGDLAQSHPVVDLLSGISSSASEADDDEAEFAGVYGGHGAVLCWPGFQGDWAQGEVGFGTFEKIPRPTQGSKI